MSQTIKQSTFSWEGLDRQGRRVRGEMAGSNDTGIRSSLRKQGINPLKIKRKTTALFSSRGKKSITPKDIAIFSRQLATMVSSGIPLVQSFEIIGRGHENLSMQELILHIKNDIESGTSLGDSLSKHPKYFNELYINLIKAGEHAGILETILHKLAAYLEKMEALKNKVKSALFYPTAVIVVAFIITAILLIFVIPQFQKLFSNFGADLPWLTKMVIQLSYFFQSYWWLILMVIIAAVAGFFELKKRNKKFASQLDKFSLKIPIVGSILEKSAIARFSRTLSIMFAAGTPLVDAMGSVAGACGNQLYLEATLKMRDEVATGSQLQAAMRESQLFPNMVVQMIAIGEESGSLDTMLGKVADWYEDEVNDAVEALTSLLEPIIMAVLGTIVGGLVIAMYLPIFKMGSVV